MNIIEKNLPLDTVERVDSLMAELQSVPGAMTPSAYQMIVQSIHKLKVQLYFKETYPVSLFTDAPTMIPAAPAGIKTMAAPVSQHNAPVVTEKKIMPIPDECLGKKKFVYGTYFEMAFHNFFLTLRHIYLMSFGTDIMDQARTSFQTIHPNGRWDEDFGNEKYVWGPMFRAFRYGRPEEKMKADQMLDKHFPFLVPFIDFTAKSRDFRMYDKIEILKRLSQVLRTLRNYFSHYSVELFENQVDNYLGNELLICLGLKNTYLASKREVKTRFGFSDYQMGCAEQYEFFVGRGRDERGRPLKEKREVKGFRYKIDTDDTDGNGRHLTAFGLLSLASLFLEKKYSKIFSDKVNGVAPADQSVICEMLAVYRIRMKVQKLTVTKPAQALALDIINELQRCPKELFEQLSPDDQQTFRLKAEEDEVGQEVLMVRYSDRFPALVMRYIDDAKLFQDIRFQVSLGKYFFRFYKKRCIDGAVESRIRALSKDINGFGRLEDVERARKEVWEGIVREYEDVHCNTADEKPYITDHHAQYVINGNRIAMRIFDGEERTFIPELMDDGARNMVPTCWMSTYELPAMMMLMHLTDSAYVEEIIKYCVAGYRRLFEDVRDGKVTPLENESVAETFLEENYGGIRLKDVPKTLQEYLSGKTTDMGTAFVNRTKGLIEKLIEQTEYKLEKLRADRKKVRNGKMNKIGKTGYVQLKPGRIATFIAKDMMFFQPDDGSNNCKLTELNFRVLQSVIATYGGGKAENVGRTLTAAHIIGRRDDELCNPIVMKVWNSTLPPRNIFEFYELYLKERLAYLKECIGRDDLTVLPFVHADRMMWQQRDEEFCRARAGRYLMDEYGGTTFEKALELPRGLFDKYIREQLREMKGLGQMADDMTKNTAYLIYAYFLHVMGDDCQPFYDTPRTYPILNTLYRKSPRDAKVYRTGSEIRAMLCRNNDHAVTKEVEKFITQNPRLKEEDKERMPRMIKAMKENETLLKRFKVQDMILFLIAKRILLDGERYGSDEVQFQAIESIMLKDLTESNALSKKIKVSIEVMTRNGYMKQIVKEDLKLKNYAMFYQILNDRRLPTLLDLVQTDTVSHDLLEMELSGYDKVHPAIMKGVLEYEKRHANEGMTADNQGNFSSMVFVDKSLSEKQKQLLVKVRNAFAHCIYPQYAAIKEVVDKEIPEKAIGIEEAFTNEILKSCETE